MKETDSLRESTSPGIETTDSESASALLDNEIQFERLIAELSATFIHLPVERVDSSIEGGLDRLGRFLGMDFGTLIQIDPKRSQLQHTHEWHNDGVDMNPEFLGMKIDEQNYPWLVQELRQGRAVRICRPDDFPPEAVSERETCKRIGIRSVVWVPYFVSQKLQGFVVFNTTKHETVWTDSIMSRLQLAGEIFGNALNRKQAWEKLEERACFERLVAEITSGFSSVKSEEIDQLIAVALSRIGTFMGAERCCLGFLSEDRTRFVKSHAWVADGVPVSPSLREEGSNDMVWFLQQTLEGETLAVNDLDALPPEPRAALEREDIKGLVVLPIMTDDRVVGDLILHACLQPQTWSDDLLQRLRIVADVVGHAIARDRLDQELREALAENEALRERLEADNLHLRREIEQRDQPREIIGDSPAIRQVLELARSVAETDSTVLILGETGTGKELVARFIHQKSNRRGQPLIKVNCGALPATLVEAELFGREKGAYTGAMSKQIGRFEIADGATIFLDEIGDLPTDLQVKLLRVLQDGEFERLGGRKTVRVDARVIAATNTDLGRAVKRRLFREDLFYRINVFPITVLPLRERPEDIPLLLWAFVQEFIESMGKPVESIPRQTIKALTRYSWPGNVRELRNVVERAMILHAGPRLEIDVPGEEISPDEDPDSTSLDAVQRWHILKVLERTRWRLRGDEGAAELLDMKPSTLEYRMKKLGIKRPQ
jgi:transcriptional regulator with GAF, ATPase, and Fis domain